MKKLLIPALLVVGLLTGNHTTMAQMVVPDLSPFATVTQKIGFNEVRIEYSRPSVRGRIIFGELVPYNKVWRLGANASTKLFTREDLIIEGTYKLPAGVYALYAVPGKDEWTMLIYKDPWLWGAFGYKEAYTAIKFTVKPQVLKEQVETFTIQFANVCTSCAELQFQWDLTQVSFRLSSDADERAVANIKSFTQNPESRLAGEYYLAAKYYLDTNRELDQALAWADKSLEYGPAAYWVMHTKAEIQAKMGDFKGAIETANQSKELAKAKNDEDYVRINELDIEKWKVQRKNRSE